MFLRRFYNVLLTIVIVLSSIAPAIIAHGNASAVSASDWQSGRIIDDSVFFNSNSMSSDDIQTFLNSKVSTCTAKAGNPTCLKSYTVDMPNVPADAYCSTLTGGSNYNVATIVKLVSAACSINPQVMLVLMQKEQGLVTSTAPTARMYQFATGFCVYDTTPPPSCAGTDGFFNQIYYAARQFQKYVKNPQTYSYAVGQTDFVPYCTDSSCGGTNVTMQTQATAALYNYTPYQPNQASLNAGFGTGDSCSSYGNRNFWLYFWSWFGNPIGAEYAWLIDSFTYSNGDNILTKGYTETLTLKAKNISRHPWYNSGDHPVRLGTWNPANRNSSIFPQRLATMQESEVDPNQEATFQWQVNPSQVGTFVEALNLVVENYTWMTWPGFSPTIVVSNSPYQWQVNSVSYGNGTGVMDPGTTQSMTVRVTNTGNVTWNKTSPPIWLATWPPGRVSSVQDPVNGKWPSATRITQFNEASVPPGSQASFQFDVAMPSGGDHYEQLNLVAEGQSWFNDVGLTLFLHGKTYQWKPVWTSISTGNVNIPRNTDFTVTIKAHNSGEETWTKTNFPIRLGTDNPMNRGSGLYSPSWISDTRPATLVENSVPAGQDGTFTFTAHTPSTPGARDEYFNLLAEGLLWFPDPNYKIHINVL